MNPIYEFVERWSKSTLREQQGAQSHFIELCELLEVPTPAKADPNSTFFAFEEQVTKSSGGRGRADVWYKGRFAWEYKSKHKNLELAYTQLETYRADLGNPPLLVVCDFDQFIIYPQWTNINTTPFVIRNVDLLDSEYRKMLKWVLTDPEQFLRIRQKEQEDSRILTEALAKKFADLAEQMRHYARYEVIVRGEDGQFHEELLRETPLYTPLQIARFLTRVIFVLFAEDISLLPLIGKQSTFGFILNLAAAQPESFVPALSELFMAMNGDKPDFIYIPIPWFNGGLFEAGDDENGFPAALNVSSIPNVIGLLSEAHDADWSKVDPTIFGTLFERALDPAKRAQLGAHYTGKADIQLVLDPVLIAGLRREWDTIQEQARPHWITLLDHTTAPRAAETARLALTALHDNIMRRIAETTVLDPACGSGNFLYISLRLLKDLEGEVRQFFTALELPFRDVVTPRQLFGIERDPFAARLARVVVWIGYLQWRYEREGDLAPVMRGKPRPSNALPNPILRDKDDPNEPDHILNDDAILRYDADGKPYEPDWHPARVIVGNPPFLGGNRIRQELGGYVDDLFALYDGRVPAFADLVCYWFEKARAQIEAGQTTRAGLLATNSIRGGVNREVLKRIKETGDIFLAYPDHEWRLGSAAVRISIIGFDDGSEPTKAINQIDPVQPDLVIRNMVTAINADLTENSDATAAIPLHENGNICFRSDEKGGSFDIDETTAIEMLEAQNPNGLPNSDVVRPYVNGLDITRRLRHQWVIDFGSDTPIEQAQGYVLPFEYVQRVVKPERDLVRNERERTLWWLHRRPAPDMRTAVSGLSRFIGTPAVAKHRLFVWFASNTIPDHQIYVFARDDDYFFGVLHSYLHEVWALRLGTSLEDRPRYTPTTTFETFPLPFSPGHEDTGTAAYQAISTAAQALHEERAAWLNPPDLLGLGAKTAALRERTLTNLYNALSDFRRENGNGKGSREGAAHDFAPRLAALHDALDAAVLSAYGWADLVSSLRTDDGQETVLRRLLALNAARAGR